MLLFQVPEGLLATLGLGRESHTSTHQSLAFLSPCTSKVQNWEGSSRYYYQYLAIHNTRTSLSSRIMAAGPILNYQSRLVAYVEELV